MPPGEWTALLQAVSEAYQAADRDRKLLENALEVNAQELTDANKKLRVFIDNAPVGIVMLDREMRYLFASQRWLRDRQLTIQNIVGKSHYELNPTLPQHWREAHRRCLEGATESGAEDPFVRPDGSVIWTKWEVRPWLDTHGTVGGIILMSEDITERKRTEEQMRIAAVAFQSRDGMIVTDQRGIILQVNQAFSEVTGYGAEEAIGKTASFLRSGRHDATFYRTLWEAIMREGHWEGEIWNRRKDGGIYPEWLSISGVKNGHGHITHYLGTFSDIREPREAERKILELAFYDPLTGLPNRRLLLDRLQQALIASTRNRQFGAVLLLDLDHFKTVNDTRGHDVGDQLLIEIARRLRTTLRETDSAARLGGDEFVVLFEGLNEDKMAAAITAEAIAEKLRSTLCQPITLKGEVYFITPSMGVTLFCGQGEGGDTLLKQADLSLYQAKEAGRNAIRFYNLAMQQAVDVRVEMEAGLRRALSHGEFALNYQPQVDADQRLVGVEALLRWHPPGLAMVSPMTFIPFAEACGLIVPIGRWVLETACQQLAAWARDPALRKLHVSVNISARQFRQPDFIDQVRTTLQRSGARAAGLVLELTESLLLDDVEKVIQTMQSLKAMGVGFSIDDFGTGYSSLTYLKRLPLDQIKIDQSFVRDIVDDADDRAIVKAIISLATSLGLRVIAEGVETTAQRDLLVASGCEIHQGYLYGRPVLADQIGERPLPGAPS
ncbi:hypothetical protein GCM10027399_04190 [Curvibacter fontanus]